MISIKILRLALFVMTFTGATAARSCLVRLGADMARVPDLGAEDNSHPLYRGRRPLGGAGGALPRSHLVQDSPGARRPGVCHPECARRHSGVLGQGAPRRQVRAVVSFRMDPKFRAVMPWR